MRPVKKKKETKRKTKSNDATVFFLYVVMQGAFL